MLPGDPGKLFTFSTIVLINCGLVELSNLEPVGASLVHLCLSNQSITQMCGLSALPQLRHLYLQQNRIAQIEGLERWEALVLSQGCFTLAANSRLSTCHSCRKLQTLWLYDNRLTKVENLGYCTDLRELWLQVIRVHVLKATSGGVSELVSLKTLNLANNRIRDVEEFEHLRKLIALRQLTFRDEHFGSNPIVDHPDYRSFAVTTLKQVCSPRFACIRCATTQAS
ncbi:hypothetical protein BBJ28_00016212 [Nothophytophthora sp. Chile5]|nr:hypothetical protein BBJ28_00016212 [Nothophytophthora sp. Chile5]